MLLIRKTDQATFVHAADDAFVAHGARQGPDKQWFLATGQPAECSRFTVHGLNTDEILRCDLGGLPEITKDSDAGELKKFQDEMLERDKLACELGFVSIDGAKPILDDFTPAAVAAVAQLVRGVSTSPLASRIYASAGGSMPKPDNTAAVESSPGMNTPTP